MAVALALGARERGEAAPSRLAQAVRLGRAASLAVVPADGVDGAALFAAAGGGAAFSALAMAPGGRHLLATDSRGALSLFRCEGRHAAGAAGGARAPAATARVPASGAAAPASALSLALSACAFYSDGGLAVTGGADGRVAVWDTSEAASSLRCVHAARAGARLHCVAMSPCAARHALCAVGSDDRAVRLLDLASGSAAHTLGGGDGGGGHAAAVLCVAWHPESESLLASAGRDGRVLFWDVRRSGPSALLGALDQYSAGGRTRPTAAATAAGLAHAGGVNALAFLHAGCALPPEPGLGLGLGLGLLTLGLDQRLRGWALEPVAEPMVRAVPGLAPTSYSASSSPSSLLSASAARAAAEDDSDLALGRRTASWASAPSSRRFACGGALRNRLARCASLCLAQSGLGGAAVAFVPCSGAAAGAADPSVAGRAGAGGPAADAGAGGAGAGVLVFDVTSGSLLRSLRGHHGGGGVTALAFREEAQELFSAGEDGLLLRWAPPLLGAGRGGGA